MGTIMTYFVEDVTEKVANNDTKTLNAYLIHLANDGWRFKRLYITPKR